MTTSDNIRSFCNIHAEGRSKEYKDDMIKELTDLVQCAIADHEKWKKFPENKPEDRRMYLVDRYVTSNYIDLDGDTVTSTHREITITRYYETPKVWENSGIIAFRELPTAYQREEGGE